MWNVVPAEAAAEQDYEEFGKQDVAKLDGSAVKELLLNAGLFAFIRQRPYDVIADPTIAPRAIFVSAFDTNPLAKKRISKPGWTLWLKLLRYI